MSFDHTAELELQQRYTTPLNNRRLIHSARLLFDLLIGIARKHGNQTVAIKDHIAAKQAECAEYDLGSVQLRLQEAGMIEVKRSSTVTQYRIMLKLTGLSSWTTQDIPVCTV